MLLSPGRATSLQQAIRYLDQLRSLSAARALFACTFFHRSQCRCSKKSLAADLHTSWYVTCALLGLLESICILHLDMQTQCPRSPSMSQTVPTMAME